MLARLDDPSEAKRASPEADRGPPLIVAKINDDKVEKHQNLEQIWTKVRDKPKFIEYVQTGVKSYLE